MQKLIALAVTALIAVPSIALAQTIPPTVSPAPAATAPQAGNLTLTDEQAKTWINKPVYSSDGKNMGEVAAFARDANGRVTEMHADVGGFLGIGETRVRILPAQFAVGTDRIVLAMTAEQAKALPQIPKK